MFFTSFSFAAALLALPLAGTPILLHLLFRQKSPVVQFSTLRFIKLSVQQTAARKKVQKWLLLAVRALLVALLILAVAQPVRLLSSTWSGGSGRSLVAAIVIDTSYSMQIKDGNLTAESRAESIVQDLLRDQLSGGKVAIFSSRFDPANVETLKDPSAILAGWTPLQPQPESKPMIDRVGSAVSFLDRQTADSKWLIVLSDFQSTEFPREIPTARGGRTVLFDLHSTQGKSDGITEISISPAQPIPGSQATVAVHATGRPGDGRPLAFSILTPEGVPIKTGFTQKQLPMDSAGHASANFTVDTVPARRWMQLTANFTDGDDMPWDDSRSQLIEVPPRQVVAAIWPGATEDEKKYVRVSLNPWKEGMQEAADWPLSSKLDVAGPTAGDDAAIVVMTRWPDPTTAATLRDFGSRGHNLVLFLSPDLAATWPSLSPAEQATLLELLPSAPENRTAVGPWHATLTDPSEPLTKEFDDPKLQISDVVVRQMVTMSASGKTVSLLTAIPSDPDSNSRPAGLCFRKPVGRGFCYTIATVPDAAVSNFAGQGRIITTLLWKMLLPNATESTAQNVEIGLPLSLSAEKFPGVGKLLITTPKNESYEVPLPRGGSAFVFDKPTVPGIYVWKTESDQKPVAMTNVQLPAAESDLTAKPAASVVPAGPNVVIASSIAELNAHVKELSTPQPQWSLPLALVLMLLCVEAMMGSFPHMWGRGTAAAVPA